MSNLSPKVHHPYPERDQEPFFETFVSTMNSVDAADFAARDDRNLVVTYDGLVTATAGGVVTYPEMTIHHSSSGFRGTLPAGQVSLSDGDSAYVALVRSPTQGYALELNLVTGGVPNTNNAFAVFVRVGTTVWIRGVGVITGTQFIPGDMLVTPIPFVINGQQGDGPATLGRLRLRTNDYMLAGTVSVTLNLKVEAQVATDLQDADIDFYDATSGDVLKQHWDLSSDQPALFEATFTSEDDDADRVYELRAGMDSGGGPYDPEDVCIIWHAMIEVIQNF